MLTTEQFQKHFGVAYTTVLAWLKQGRVVGAKQVATPRGPVWEIPTCALHTFKPPPMGRPKKGAKKGKK